MTKRICDRCNNYQVSPGGCVETCFAKYDGVVQKMTDSYINKRFMGEKNFCKGFKSVVVYKSIKS